MSFEELNTIKLPAEIDWAIEVKSVSKCYRIYARPVDRLKEVLFSRTRALAQRLWLTRLANALKGRAPKRFSGLVSNTQVPHFYQEFWSLRDVSLMLKRGEVLGVVGVNGAGKSSLLQLICGVLQASSGSVHVKGRIAALLELGAGFNPDFTGRENIQLNATLLGLSPQEINDKMQSIIEFSGVENFIDQPVRTYSSGMYVRLAFSIATSVDPDILVIDEALSVGDGAFARKSFDRIMALKDKGVTILFCSHSIYQVESLCERAIWLDHGTVRASGSAAQVCLKYNQFLDQIAQKAANQNVADPHTLTATSKSKSMTDERLRAQSAFAGSTQASTEGNIEPERNALTPCASSMDLESSVGLGSLEGRPDLPSSKAKSSIADGVARLQRVSLFVDDRLLASTERPLLHSLQSNLQVNVTFTASLSLPCPSVALVVTDHTGRNISSCSNFYDQVTLARNEFGVGSARVAFPKIQLLRGEYVLSVFLMCEKALHIYDTAQVCEFDVEQEGREIGLVSLNRYWVS